MLRSSISAIALVSLAFLLTTVVHAEQEPNDSIATALPIIVGVVGSTDTFINPQTDVDYFRFNATATKDYIIEVLNVALDLGTTKLDVYNQAGTRISGISFCNGSGDVCNRIKVSSSVDQPIFLRVAATSTTKTGAYKVRVLAGYGQTEWLVNGSSEPNDTIEIAAPIEIGLTNQQEQSIYQRNSQYITVQSDKDYFRLSAEANKTYTVEVFNVAADLGTTELAIFDERGTLIRSINYCNGNGDICNRVEFTVSLAGTYFAFVAPTNDNKFGTYSVRVLPRFDQGLTWDELNENNDTNNLANVITLGTPVIHSIYPRNTRYNTSRADQDTFHFLAEANTKYTIEVFNVASDLGTTILSVSDERGVQIKSINYCNGEGSTCNKLEVTISLASRLFIEISPTNNSKTGIYSLCVDTTNERCGTEVKYDVFLPLLHK